MTSLPKRRAQRQWLGLLRGAPDCYGRRWTSNQFAEAPQVLGDGRQGKLELRPAWAPQSQSSEAQNALQVGEQHFNLLAIAACLGKLLRPGEGTSHITGFFVHIAWHLALRRCWTAFGFERARAAIVRARPIEQRCTAIDQSSAGLQYFAGRAGVDVAFLVVNELLT